MTKPSPWINGKDYSNVSIFDPKHPYNNPNHPLSEIDRPRSLKAEKLRLKGWEDLKKQNKQSK